MSEEEAVYVCVKCGAEYDALYVSVAIQSKTQVKCICGGQLKEKSKKVSERDE